MRFKVSLKKNGKEFDEVVIANNKKEAMEVALKNNPEAQALNSDWTFKIKLFTKLRNQKRCNTNNTYCRPRRKIKDYRENKSQK